ncbi:uncharacterized protein [Panulirus ornatus]|uniref:uncharacterized protein n=1 Tax=Panulirus ornatus TaxID=150431 RepID=UPI003A8A43CB
MSPASSLRRHVAASRIIFLPAELQHCEATGGVVLRPHAHPERKREDEYHNSHVVPAQDAQEHPDGDLRERGDQLHRQAVAPVVGVDEGQGILQHRHFEKHGAHVDAIVHLQLQGPMDDPSHQRQMVEEVPGEILFEQELLQEHDLMIQMDLKV